MSPKLFAVTAAAFVSLSLSSISFAGPATDSHASRADAAKRYLQAMPVTEMLDRTFDQMAQTGRVPPSAITNMKKSIDKKKLEQATSEALVKNFTTEEINALTQFYGSPIGHSIQEKFPKYMAELQPTIMNLVMEAAKKQGLAH